MFWVHWALEQQRRNIVATLESTKEAVCLITSLGVPQIPLLHAGPPVLVP